LYILINKMGLRRRFLKNKKSKRVSRRQSRKQSKKQSRKQSRRQSRKQSKRQSRKQSRRQSRKQSRRQSRRQSGRQSRRQSKNTQVILIKQTGGVGNNQEITELDLEGIISDKQDSLIKQAIVLPENIDFETNKGVEIKKIGNKNFKILVVDYETADYNKYKAQSNNKYEIQRGDDGIVSLNKVNDNQSPMRPIPPPPVSAGPAASALAPVVTRPQAEPTPAPQQPDAEPTLAAPVNDDDEF
jgi:transposase